MDTVLIISIVGAGSVFLGLVLLWLLILLLVKLTGEKPIKKTTAAVSIDETEEDRDLECKRLAAAAAAAAAVALMNASFASSTHEEMQVLTPWQSGHRSRQLTSTISAKRKDIRL